MYRLLCLLVAHAVALTALADAHPKLRRAIHRVPDSYLVRLAEPIPTSVSETLSDLARDYSIGRGQVSSLHPLLAAGIFRVSAEKAESMLADPRIAHIAEDSEVILTGGGSNPNWNLDRMDNRLSPRLDGSYGYCQTGKGVKAYVVDTGIWGEHNEFLDAEGESSRVVPGWDWEQALYPGRANLSADPPCSHTTTDPKYDFTGSHGTAVASVLGGRTLGAAPEVTLVAVRALKCDGGGGSGSVNRVIQGLTWVYQQTLVERDPLADPPHPDKYAGRIINMSFIVGVSPGEAETDLEEVIRATLIPANITVVVAAGNFNQNVEAWSPARRTPPIVVGASKGHFAGAFDRRWDDGPLPDPENGDLNGNPGWNWGATIDIFAPGDRIRSAHWRTGSHEDSNGTRDPTNTRWASGTSFAAPLVAGAAARYLQFYKDASPAEVRSFLIFYATDAEHGLNMDNRGALSPTNLLFMPQTCFKRRSV